MVGIKKLDYSFYNRKDVVGIARDLLGKILVTRFGNTLTSGRIVETEAYNGVVDKASHAWSNRRTKRTEVMYGEAATAYVYLCYGIHHLFNVVTGKKDLPHAVLIRALEPLEGIDRMLIRRGKTSPGHTLTKGPGNMAKAMGLLTVHTGASLLEEEIYIADDGFRLRQTDILSSPRIGVDYAGEDAALPYRFYIRGNPWVSGLATGKVRKR